ncbi:hypothetical protein LTR53_002062 [Teratosphaeriaceae sp. CCFEE 6253]|nr:hypothetical protein LTR53_002062 [Teratosphaeriaceae sp. CCFEE 6253]
MACEYARSFLRAGLLKAEEICIMSPFRAQVNVLRKLARGKTFGMRDVSIGPLEAFQGLESRLVILCTTRTRARFVEQDLARGLGIIHEPKRFNVALTRAKEGLVVIGNPAVLGKDVHWGAFLGFCRRNGLWEGGVADSKQAKGGGIQAVSRLEKQMVRAQEGGARGSRDLRNGAQALGVADDEEFVLWQSGVEMENVLREVEAEEEDHEVEEDEVEENEVEEDAKDGENDEHGDEDHEGVECVSGIEDDVSTHEAPSEKPKKGRGATRAASTDVEGLMASIARCKTRTRTPGPNRSSAAPAPITFGVIDQSD